MNCLKISLNDIKLVLKEKMALFWMFIAPIIFISFFGILFREPHRSNPIVYIQNNDKKTTLAKSLEILLAKKNVDIVKKKKGYPLIIIPPNATEKLAAGEKVNIELRIKDEADLKASLILLKLQSCLMSIVMSLDPELLKKEFTEKELAKEILIEPTIELKEESVIKRLTPTPYGFQATVPQTLVMLVLIFLFTGSAAELVVERTFGYMKRLMIAPVKNWEIISAKIISRIILSMLQIAFIVIIGKYIFKISWGDDLLALFILLFIFAIACSSMGIYYSTHFRDAGKCAGLGAIIVMIMSALGGCWWPLDIVPFYLRYVAFIFPTGWTMDALIKIMSYNYRLSDIIWNICYLLILSSIFIPLSSKNLLPKN